MPLRWIDRGTVAIFPGLIDCHTHLPQYSAVARGESQLLPWLRENIFPVEREFTGPKAKEEAPLFFHELARNGTTTAMVYAAIYEDSCEVGFEAAEQSGLRVILGKMMMDIGSYGQLQPKKVLSVSLLESERLCRKWHGADNGRLEYAFSPRFAVTCSEKLMRSAGRAGAKVSMLISRHISRKTAKRLKRCIIFICRACDYTHVYEKCGLLTPKDNAWPLHPPERARNRRHRRGAIEYRSLSDLESLSEQRPAQARSALKGWSCNRSRLRRRSRPRTKHVAGHARRSRCAKSARNMAEPNLPRLRPSEAFYLATSGGARALGKSATIGSLDAGKEADLIVVDLAALLPYGKQGRRFDDLSTEDVISLCIYRGGPQANLETYVRGEMRLSRARVDRARMNETPTDPIAIALREDIGAGDITTDFLRSGWTAGPRSNHRARTCRRRRRANRRGSFSARKSKFAGRSPPAGRSGPHRRGNDPGSSRLGPFDPDRRARRAEFSSAPQRHRHADAAIRRRRWQVTCQDPRYSENDARLACPGKSGGRGGGWRKSSL